MQELTISTVVKTRLPAFGISDSVMEGEIISVGTLSRGSPPRTRFEVHRRRGSTRSVRGRHVAMWVQARYLVRLRGCCATCNTYGTDDVPEW